MSLRRTWQLEENSLPQPWSFREGVDVFRGVTTKLGRVGEKVVEKYKQQYRASEEIGLSVVISAELRAARDAESCARDSRSFFVSCTSAALKARSLTRLFNYSLRNFIGPVWRLLKWSF